LLPLHKRLVFVLALLLVTAVQFSLSSPASAQGNSCLFFTETGGGQGGFSVCNDGQAQFRAAFERYGLQRVGYPISQRYTRDGFITQAFQKAIFQWRADTNTVALVNTFDDLHNMGYDQRLLETRQTPHQLPANWDTPGATFEQIRMRRQELLNARPALRTAYFSVADPLLFYGLPTSEVTDMGNHYAIRLQRAVLQEWKEAVPWAAAGQVTVANGGDIAKELGALPAAALRPEAAPPAPPAGSNCHPSYPTVCIPPPPPDLDCEDIPANDFPIVGDDPHNLDGSDNDGIGCESPAGGGVPAPPPAPPPPPATPPAPPPTAPGAPRPVPPQPPDLPAALAQRIHDATFEIRHPVGNPQVSGSGIMVGSDGRTFITAYHVLAASPTGFPATIVSIGPFANWRYTAEVLATDPALDIAIMRVREPDFPGFAVAPVGTDSPLREGDPIYTFSYPGGRGELVRGKGSYLGRLELEEPAGATLIVTDAFAYFGSSGGVAVNAAGEVIGIVDAGIIGRRNVEDITGWTGVNQVTLLVPIDDVAALMIQAGVTPMGYRIE
jgi:hypothetical protein